MEKLKVNLYIFLKIVISFYVIFFLFTNMSILFFSDKMTKYFIIKFDNLVETSSDQTRNKLADILSKYSIEINYQETK